MKLDLRYSIPITEGFEGNDFIIQGMAINETTTSNNHKFIAEELITSADTLTGCPLLVDHENKVSNIKGRVIKGWYDEILKGVPFKAKVMDEECKNMIRDGRLNSVSVGAMVKDVEEKDGELIPRGIVFKELSLVAVPADSGATFSIAMKEAYSQLIGSKSDTLPTIERQIQQINPENAEELVKDVQGVDNTTFLKGGLEQMSEVIEAVKVDENAEIKSKLEASEKAIKELSEKLASLSMPKVEEKAVLVNEFEVTELEEKDYKIEMGNGSFSYVANKY